MVDLEQPQQGRLIATSAVGATDVFDRGSIIMYFIGGLS